MDNTTIRDLFAKDINRSINGVVKVQDSKDGSIRQELDEYVVTRELQRHFATFFKAYGDAIDVPTDKIGVWISGFFGSGKSHFLKMLSYLLENRQIGGKSAHPHFYGLAVATLTARSSTPWSRLPWSAPARCPRRPSSLTSIARQASGSRAIRLPRRCFAALSACSTRRAASTART